MTVTETYLDCCWCSREVYVDDLCGSDEDPMCSRCCTVTHGREAHA